MTDDDASVLIAFLDAQRTRALNIIAGLDERQLRTAVLPSGWTPLGMIEHLGHAERHWFQEVALGTADPLPWQDDGKSPGEPFASDPRRERELTTQPSGAALSSAIFCSQQIGVGAAREH